MNGVYTRIGYSHREDKKMKLQLMKIVPDGLWDIVTTEQLGDYKRKYKLHDDMWTIEWTHLCCNKCFVART